MADLMFRASSRRRIKSLKSDDSTSRRDLNERPAVLLLLWAFAKSIASLCLPWHMPGLSVVVSPIIVKRLGELKGRVRTNSYDNPTCGARPETGCRSVCVFCVLFCFIFIFFPFFSSFPSFYTFRVPLFSAFCFVPARVPACISVDRTADSSCMRANQHLRPSAIGP